MKLRDRSERDRLLRRSVLTGDERAWREWFDESFDELYAYVHWRCGARREQADEVISETWLTAVRRVRKYDPARASFPTWLKGIATNVLRSQLRELISRNRRHEQVEVESLADGSIDAGEIEDRRRHRSRRIALTLNQLPDHYDEVLRSKYLENLSVAEIAAARGETPKAVELILWRARKLFREIYRKDGEEI